MILDRQTAIIGIAIATLVVPLLFVAAAVAAWRKRNRGAKLGPGFESLVTLLGAASLGTFALWSGPPLLLGAPLYVGVVLMAFISVGRRRRIPAGWIVAGFALPWTTLWFIYVVAMLAGTNFEPLATWGGFLVGLAVILFGLFVVSRGDPERRPDPLSAEGGKRPRTFGDMAQAIGEPAVIGIFRTTDLAAIVALVTVWVVVGFIPTPNRIINVAAAVVLGAVVASEAHIRAMPSRMRRAFEAFSWLGEWEIARLRALTGGGVPLKPGAAEAWLEEHPETPETRMIRAEILVVAKRIDEARATVERMATATPEDRFERASVYQTVDWMAGGEGDLPALEAAVRDLEPVDSDQRLRGEVALAAARTRGLIGDPGSADPLAPLLEVRERLGRRADGQVGRALRKRLIPTFLIWSLAFGVIAELTTGGMVP